MSLSARILGLALAAVWLDGAGARAQSTISRDCYRVDSEACRAERAQRAEQLYGLATVERLAADGIRVRRAFFVNPYLELGQEAADLGVVSFSRARGEEPVMAFALPPEHGLTYPAITAPVPSEAWDKVLAFSAYFDRRSLDDDETETICNHPWEHIVEAADPADPAEDGYDLLVRRRYEYLCGEDNMAVAFAQRLAALAASLFPECAPLDPDRSDRPIELLRTCARLAGDRRAAVAAHIASDSLLRSAADDPARAGNAVFAQGAVLDWSGRRTIGRDAAAARWWRVVPERSWLRWHRIDATSADRAEAQGALIDVGRRLAARLQVTWVRGADGRFVAERLVVGRFIALRRD